MKKSLFLFIAIITSVLLSAQTTVVDPNNANNGTINSGLLFGSPTGEGIASKRNSGGNQYGLDFYTNHINRIAITNGGFVGIGTTTPQKQLSIAAGMNIDQLNQNPGTVLVNTLTFGSGSGEGIGSNRTGSMNQYGLDFYTASLPRLYITNAGNVGIGVSNPNVKLQVNGAIASSAGLMPSDIRYKKNIVPIHHALKTVMALSAYSYLFRKVEFPEMNFDSRPQFGLIAQDVEKVLPQLVYNLNDGYKAIDYPKLIPLLIEGMKEQQQIIEKQQRQIDEIKKLLKTLLEK